MQGPGGVLNIVTIPPGATSTEARIVIDGITGEIDVYGAGGGLAITISSLLDAILVYAE
jgi:hypothetical protein